MSPLVTTIADAYYVHVHMTHNYKSTRALVHSQPMQFFLSVCLSVHHAFERQSLCARHAAELLSCI